jgi:hypothetical protein
VRWVDVDLEVKTLSIVNYRVQAGNRAVENDHAQRPNAHASPLTDSARLLNMALCCLALAG